MTAQSAAIDVRNRRPGRGRPVPRLPTVIRKELTEWLRGPKALIVAGVSVAGAVFMTLIPFIASDERTANPGRAEPPRPDDGSDGQRPARLDRPDRRPDRDPRDDGAHLDRARPGHAGLDA